MFTGIVEEAGEVVGVADTDGGRRLRVAGSFADELSHGQSISVSGACLTVEDFDSETFELFLSAETLDRTYLDRVVEGDVVNLERALRADGRLDGHIVQGHVDATGEVTRVEAVGEDWTFGFSLPEGMGKYVVEKGSVAVDGISLTVADRLDGAFTTAIIPATYELTNLGEKSVGDPVHLEVDVVAKYVENLASGYLG
ncbi:MAG: riboflavin synthase [Haloarculaceae archaeon]